MAEMLRLRGVDDEAAKHDADAKSLADVIERESWDGAWYRRAYFDDGDPIGSAESDEAKIDSIAQAWAVISGAACADRAAKAMAAGNTYLMREDWQILQLFTPPFDQTRHDPGYIKGYVPGVRENGGQYTHAALWTPMAFARMGDGEQAVKLLQLMNPIEHSRDPAGAERYAVEPYVVAADVYALAGQEGRGGWTWYTGSSAWMYRVWIEEVLGLHLSGNNLTISPVIPPSWPGFTMRLRHGGAQYMIQVVNPGGPGHGVASIALDGAPHAGLVLPLTRNGGEHEVVVTLSK
jgi:cyclic beta-1,2-glucan synthetase